MRYLRRRQSFQKLWRLRNLWRLRVVVRWLKLPRVTTVQN
jgi:hypothetical protein